MNLVRLNSNLAQDFLLRRGLTLTTLAARAGTSYQTARRGVKGVAISAANAQRLCRALKIGFEKLVSEVRTSDCVARSP